MLCGEGVISDVWGREIGHAEERREVLIDNFNVVREEIVLGPFPTHLGGTRLGRTRFTDHPAFMDKPSTSRMCTCVPVLTGESQEECDSVSQQTLSPRSWLLYVDGIVRSCFA